MAAFNFPNSPSTNDLHTENSVTWKWNGTVWKRINNSYLTASTLDVSGIGTFGGNVDINSTLEVSGISNFDSTVKIADKIEHLGDSNTAIRFPSADTVTIETAGSEALRVDSGGDTNFSGNIQIPDIIQHAGDVDTRIRFPAADTVTVETAGSERLRITSDGKVGMGVPSTSPGSTCNPDGNTLLIRAASTFQTTKGHIMLSGDGATNGEGPQIVFSESGSGGNFAGAYVGHVRTGGNSIGDLVFGTRATGGDANTVPTERLRITSTGFVGIGTDNPVRKLHVEDDNAEIALYQSRRAAGSYVNYKVGANGAELGMIGSGAAILSGGADAGDFGVRSTGDIRISTGGHAEKMCITSGGNIGIGTVNPYDYDPGAESLVVCGPGGNVGQSGITIVSGSDKYGCLYFGDGTGSSSYRGRVEYRHDIDVLQMGAGGAHGDLVLNAGGDMFLRGDSTCYIVLGSAGDATTGGANNSMNWIRGNGNNLLFNSATGTHNWEVAGSEKMQLEADGDLQLVSKSQCRITLGNAGSPGGNDSNWIRGDGNNIMMNCATTGGEHIFEVAGTARAKISPSKGVRAENTCKAWVCYKHDGGVSAIHDSFFVSSVTDEGTGIFGIDFEGDMGTEDAIAYQVGSHSQTPVTVGGVAYTPSYGSQNPWWSMEDDWVRINLQKVSDSGNTYTNSEWWNLIAFGDAI